MILYQDKFYMTDQTRFFVCNNHIMLNSLKEVEEYLTIFVKRSLCNPYVGHYVVKVMDPYKLDMDYPKDESYLDNIYKVKDIASRNSISRYLYISPDVKQIYAEIINAKCINKFGDDDTVSLSFDYGLMYGNYKPLITGNVYKTTFFNSLEEWDPNLSDFSDMFPEIDELEDNTLFVQEVSKDLSWTNDLKSDTFKFGDDRVGYQFKLITKDFNHVYTEPFELMGIPVATITPADEYNGKKFSTFYGAWEKEEE